MRNEVEGEEVEIGRLGIEAGLVFNVDVVACFVAVCAEGAIPTPVAAGDDEPILSGLICVWILVFTTSKGHVRMPAMQPADAPVNSSSGSPISLLPMHAFANFCSCS
jgi:hypothetical protein